MVKNISLCLKGKANPNTHIEDSSSPLNKDSSKQALLN